MSATKPEQYRALLAKWGECKDDTAGDALLDQLDVLWYSMTTDEQDELEGSSHAVAQIARKTREPS